MEFLPLANRVARADQDRRRPGRAADQRAGKNVIIIGGGDTGADCLGTAHRQGAASVTQLEIMPRPRRAAREPAVADLPHDLPVSSAHEEGGERVYAVTTQEFLGDEAGRARAAAGRGGAHRGEVRPVPGTERELPCELVLLAMGFTGAAGRLLNDPASSSTPRERGQGRLVRHPVPGVFVAGDIGRGQSLIVRAIAEGRSAAPAVDMHLEGNSTPPASIPLTARPWA